MKGLFYQNHFSNTQKEEPLRTSVEHLEQAIALDPGLALAHAGVSYSCSVLVTAFGRREFIPKAKAAARKALELDEGLAEAHAALALTQMDIDWDWAGAEREFRRAIELNQGGSWVRFFYAFYLMKRGRYEDALLEWKRAEEVDPLTLATKYNIGSTYYCEGRYDEAVEHYRKTVALSPRTPWLRAGLGNAYVAKGMYSEAKKEFDKCLQLSGGDLDEACLAGLGRLHAVSGTRSEALRIAKEFEKRSPRTDLSFVGPASIYSALGDKERAFALLEKAYEQRFPAPWLIELSCGPDFGNLRSEPGFQDLLRRMNFPE